MFLLFCGYDGFDFHLKFKTLYTYVKQHTRGARSGGVNVKICSASSALNSKQFILSCKLPAITSDEKCIFVNETALSPEQTQS